MQRDVQGAGDVGVVVLLSRGGCRGSTTGRWWRTCGEVGEGGPRQGGRASLGPVLGAAGRSPASSSMPMRTSSRWASATCSARLAEQRQGGAPRHQPAEVGGELAVEAEVVACPATCPAAKAIRLRRSTTHSPARAAGGCPPCRPARAGSGRDRPGQPRWPGPCARSRRARRPGRRASASIQAVSCPVSTGLARRSLPMVDDVRRPGSSRAEAAEAVGGPHLAPRRAPARRACAPRRTGGAPARAVWSGPSRSGRPVEP